ncbi:MlaD family protein [Holospora curviuscula]|nr:MlaD family protein [Holospora curviuscula]
MYARFDSIDGYALEVGAPVTINGVTVGQVKKFILNVENGTVKVKFRISKKIQLPEDSFASVSEDVSRGEKVLKIYFGSSNIKMSPGSTLN